MIHPHTELRYINSIVGYGVFATDFIPQGTIVYVKDSMELEISPEEFYRHTPELQTAIDKYSYIDERGFHIVSWDFAKYVNHCCNCNTISTGYGFEIAIRDILPGEQITDEYGIFNLDKEFELVCGEKNCRKAVHPDDFDRFYRKWDRVIKDALRNLNRVDQPLINLMDPATKAQLDLYFEDPSRYKSVYSLKCGNKEAVHA